jgi:hypothetical protein
VKEPSGFFDQHAYAGDQQNYGAPAASRKSGGILSASLSVATATALTAFFRLSSVFLITKKYFIIRKTERQPSLCCFSEGGRP